MKLFCKTLLVQKDLECLELYLHFRGIIIYLENFYIFTITAVINSNEHKHTYSLLVTNKCILILFLCFYCNTVT